MSFLLGHRLARCELLVLMECKFEGFSNTFQRNPENPVRSMMSGRNPNRIIFESNLLWRNKTCHGKTENLHMKGWVPLCTPQGHWVPFVCFFLGSRKSGAVQNPNESLGNTNSWISNINSFGWKRRWWRCNASNTVMFSERMSFAVMLVIIASQKFF